MIPGITSLFGKNNGNNSNKSFWISATTVAISSIVVISLATSCSGGTVQNRPTFQSVQPAATQGSNSKAPARRIMDPAFANAGKNPGLEIWRIENFKPVAYPQRDFGKFYTGDSYIVLNTQKDRNNKFSWDVHFWLGSETSQDEAGAAAILTVQLDDLLNGVPIQHRETQDHESAKFLSYFKNGVRYEQGGVGTGFRHVDVNAAGEKRLFQVKGKRNVRVRQVNLSVSSMNKGDCFILDAGNEIYVYVGSGAKRVEKLKAISAANQIRDQDHNGRARVNIIDEFSTDVDKEYFFTVLGSGSPQDVPEESTAEEDAAFETADERAVTLYKVSDAAGSLKVDTISTKPLRQEMLDTNDCFILDSGTAIFVWVGKKATAQEKSQSMVKAQDFIKSKKYPAWTHVNRIVENAESAPFKQYFATWRDLGMQHTRLIRAALGYDTDDEEEIDISGFDLLKKNGGRAIGFMPDNGQESFTQIIQFASIPVTNAVVENNLPVEETFNLILGFASYVFQYDYKNKNGDEGSILYVWEGEKAHANTKKAAMKFAETLADELGNAMIVRTVQGHEPRHFLKIFKGKLISSYTATPMGPQLFRIRGTGADDVRANEVPVDTRSLASDDAFALTLSDKVYIWLGLGASEFERETAKTRIGEYWKNKPQEVIDEGAEPEEFWEPLGGEGVYDTFLGSSGAPILEPRLFHCKIMYNGKIRVEEIPNYEQADLDIDDVMLLDGGDEVYAWVGDGTTAEEKDKAIQMAVEYMRKDPSHRTVETVPIIKLHKGSEPKCFKRLFPSWEEDYWKSMPSYDDIKMQVNEANEQLNNQVEE